VRSLLRVATVAAATTLVAFPLIRAQAHAQAQPGGGITLAIDSISPQIATATSEVVVSGTVTNGTGSALTGLAVELSSAQAQFSSRDLMDDFTTGDYTPQAMIPDGNSFTFASTLRPGTTANWRVDFAAADAGMSEFGVYGLEAELIDPAGTVLRTDRSLLPYWQGRAADTYRLKIAWIWPLIDQPYSQACDSLTSNDLEPSLAAGGRLSTLLAVGAGAPAAQLTWAIDPALLDNAETMSSRYSVGGSAAYCTGATPERGSTAASTWLSTLKQATAGQPVIITPYANVDVAALVHHGLTGDLKSAYLLGQEVAVPVLNKAFLITVALPAGGLADQSVLTALAATEHVPSVVVNSDEMPPEAGDGLAADDAVATWASGEGSTMTVLLADNTLTNVLKGAGTASAAGQFAIKQRFLAETAMIAAEAPNEPRSVVISPPETWGPSAALAKALLRETTTAPWLQPVPLENLTGTGARAAGSQTVRKPPPSYSVGKRELSGRYLASVSALDANLSVFTSMLYQPGTGYQNQLTEALAATESAAWRDSPASTAQGQALVNGLNQYLSATENDVKIIPTGQISMAGASGVLPVTIQNSLKRQSIRVRLVTSVVTARNAANTLKIGEQKLITIPPQQDILVKPYVHSAPQGSTTINLILTTANGTPLTWTKTKLTVDSTRYGQAILILIAGAIGLLLLSSAVRSSRNRRLNPPVIQQVGDEDPGSPGNVMTSAHDPTEAPDDLADARRWADDT
jgi:hypothetical protein